MRYHPVGNLRLSAFVARLRGIGWLLALGLVAGCETELQGGLAERQADAIVVALHRAGIGATKELRGRGEEARYAVSVSKGELPRALVVLQEQRLPSRPEPGLKEIFGAGGLVPTATEERARYVAALGGELSRSLESIDGVLAARVHLALPERRDLQLDRAPERPRASVLLETRPGARIDTHAVESLVAGAVHGMERQDVAVVSIPHGDATPRTEPLVYIGPVAVARSSAVTAKWVAGASLVLHILLAGLLLRALWRGRRPQPVIESDS